MVVSHKSKYSKYILSLSTPRCERRKVSAVVARRARRLGASHPVPFSPSTNGGKQQPQYISLYFTMYIALHRTIDHTIHHTPLSDFLDFRNKLPNFDMIMKIIDNFPNLKSDFTVQKHDRVI